VVNEIISFFLLLYKVANGPPKRRSKPAKQRMKFKRQQDYLLKMRKIPKSQEKLFPAHWHALTSKDRVSL